MHVMTSDSARVVASVVPGTCYVLAPKSRGHNGFLLMVYCDSANKSNPGQTPWGCPSTCCSTGRPVCSPTFAVCRITSLATLLLNGLHLHPTPTATDPQLHSSAAAGHECLCACTSCLCLSVCLGNPVLLAASPHHHRQDRFSLSSFRYIKRG